MRYCLVLLSMIISIASYAANNVDAFLQTIVSKNKVYEKETIIVSYRLYTKSAVTSVGSQKIPKPEARMPMDVQDNVFRAMGTFRKENYQGKQYYVTDLKTITVEPEKKGKITIPAAEMSFLFNVDTGKKVRTIFGVESVYQKVEETLRTNPVIIEVMELPKSNQADFSGAIGEFKIQAEVSRNSVDRGQPFLYEIKISGTGDLRNITLPKIDLPEGLELSKEDSDESVFIVDGSFRSEKMYFYKIIPVKAETFTIPAVTFVYFDTEQKKYIELSTGEKTIKVKLKLMQGEVFT